MQKSQINNNLSIIISSCDNYSDCWEPMIYSLSKYWKENPYEINIICNHKSAPIPKVNFIKIGEDKGFCSNLKLALNEVKTEFVLLFLDDYFLEQKINSEVISNHLKHCENHKVDFLKIDFDDNIYRDEHIVDSKSIYCSNPTDKMYSINTAMAIWNRETLQSICLEGYSAWDFERKIHKYINDHELKFNCQTIHSKYYLEHTLKKIGRAGGVFKGHWTLEGVEFFKQNGFEDLISKRKIEGKIIKNIGQRFYKPNSFIWLPFGLFIRILQKLKINI